MKRVIRNQNQPRNLKVADKFQRFLVGAGIAAIVVLTACRGVASESTSTSFSESGRYDSRALRFQVSEGLAAYYTRYVGSEVELLLWKPLLTMKGIGIAMGELTYPADRDQSFEVLYAKMAWRMERRMAHSLGVTGGMISAGYAWADVSNDASFETLAFGEGPIGSISSFFSFPLLRATSGPPRDIFEQFVDFDVVAEIKMVFAHIPMRNLTGRDYLGVDGSKSKWRFTTGVLRLGVCWIF